MMSTRSSSSRDGRARRGAAPGLAVLLLAAAARPQDPAVLAGVEASLTPRFDVAVSGAPVELVLRVRVLEESRLDAAVLRGTHLDTRYQDADASTIGQASGETVVVAAGTTIERTLAVVLPIEAAAESKRVSVVWPRLPGAATSVLVVPEQTAIDVERLDLAKTQVLLLTSHGTMTLGFFPDKAPNHVKNFVKLAKSGFYDGTRFHRVIKGFMIQGGCPNTKEGAAGKPGTGDPGYRIAAELSDVRHVRGVLSMARGPDPDSAGCQFFICHGNASALDGQYSAFGELEDGQETLDKIAGVAVVRDGQSAVPIEPVHLYKAIVLPAWP